MLQIILVVLVSIYIFMNLFLFYEFRESKYYEKKVRGFDKNHEIFVMVSASLFIVILITGITCLSFKSSGTDNVVKFLFVSKDNGFEWVGLSAIIAGVGLFLNAFWSRKNYKKEMYAKTRIESLKTIQLLLADLSNLGNEYFTKLANQLIDTHFLEDEQRNLVESAKMLKELNDALFSFNRNEVELALNLRENSETNELHKAIYTYRSIVNYAVLMLRMNTTQGADTNKFSEQYSDLQLEISDSRDSLIKVAQTYVNDEWSRIERLESTKKTSD